MNTKPQVIHIIPRDTPTGGVEVAARSMQAGERDNYVFSRYYISSDNGEIPAPYVTHGKAATLLWIPNIIAGMLWVIRQRPDVLISSLWRSATILIMYKLLNPRSHGVIFLHLPKPVHVFDRCINHIAMLLADEIWTDSFATLKCRVPKRLTRKANVISFLTQHIASTPLIAPRPLFIFWGRLAPQKNLTRAVRIFAAIKKKREDSRFLIIGSDEGELVKLKKQADSIGASTAIQFHEPMSFVNIREIARDYSFFLQTSISEGMCMSVVEAMQIGLVPIVTPVGEIESYCIDGENSVIITNEEKAVTDVLGIVNDQDRFRRLSLTAMNSWMSKPTYEQSVDKRLKAII